jgi:ubiquinone/menaquinone biosynthesis C-methylase UbiE
MPADKGDSTGSWTRYWSSGRVAACSGGDDGNYFPEIKRLWTSFFTRLDNGAAILDVATGNGAVLALALEFAGRVQTRFSLCGVDRAVPSDTGLAERAAERGCELQILGDTCAEQLPFEDASFDAVTSQYALEYTDLERSLAEATRVLRDKGKLMLIMHTSESAIMNQTRVALDDLEFVLAPGGALECFEQLMKAEQHGGQLDPARLSTAHYRSCKDRFNQSAAAILKRVQGREEVQARFLNQLMTSMGEIFQHRHQHRYEMVMQKTDEIRIETLAHVDRLGDMRDAAFSPSGLERLRAMLRTCGLEITTDDTVQQQDGTVLGHHMTAVRV